MSGPRYTVEYTGANGGDGEDGGRSEPAFIRQFKQRAGLLPEAKLTDKFASDGGGSDSGGGGGLGKAKAADDGDDEGREPAARTEEEMPQIVVTPGSGVSEAELAAVQARIREAGEEAKFDEARSRVRFVRPVGGGGSGCRKTKAAGAVIAAGGSAAVSAKAEGAATAAKRSRPDDAPSAKSVCNRKLLSFDDEEGDD